jgi:hypothetical protein
MNRIEHSADRAPAQDTCHGMVQVRTCVSVHCDQCGDALGGPEFEAHYPTEDAALDAAAAQGWRVGPGGRLWCSACGPVLTCAVEGHEFTEWRAVLLDDYQELVTRLGHDVAATAGGHPARREYRYCRRCCLHESRTAVVLGEVA